MKKLLFVILCLCSLFEAEATPTILTVRVRAKDAKFIGTPIGSALVQVRNSLTGELLTKGLTQGNSGNTKLLLQNPVERNQVLTDDKTAKFQTSIDIEEPVLVDIEVLAPLSRRGAAIKGSTQLWIIPGKDILGDGIIIELPGLILDILNPSSHQVIPLTSLLNGTLSLKTSLTMLCGCAISKGGVWNSDDFEVKAILKKDGNKSGEYALTKSKENNIYEGLIPLNSAGSYEILVYAFSAKDGNSGVDKITFVIE